MPERTSYQPGTPSWVDLGTADPAAAKEFYGSLFGWEAEDTGPVEETGGYAFFLLRGRRVAGVMPLTSDDQPTAWSTYVSTDDIDALTDRAREAGAMVVAEPLAVMDAGRLAFYAHPAGGHIGAWEPARHVGAEIVDEPGSLSWNELHTRDLAGAKAFGEAVFGWRMDEMEMGGMAYTILRLGEDGVGGMMEMPPGVPDSVPAYWMTIFEVADCDATVAQLQELGGSVAAGPFEMEGVGRFAYVADPQGAQFGVITSVAPS